MYSPSLRGSQGPNSMADLFCTACDSQIGTYENEWIRLTSSYIIPKVNGTKFGIIVADEHRTVDGKEATALHGCDLSEASCSKCSKAIGHFCRNAPGKPHLVGQYIYKLSKTHLKLSRTSTHVAYNLAFGANQPQQDRARSMFTVPPRPVQSPSSYPSALRNEAARKSMGPPSSRPNSGLIIDPALVAPMSTPPNHRESSTQSAEPIREVQTVVRETTLILRRLEEQDNKLSKMSESIHDWKIQNGKLLAALMRSSPQALSEQGTPSVLETMMDDFEFMVNAAYEARSGNEELEILRAENESMKAKLQTIALAMGSAVGDNTPASERLTSPMTVSRTPSVLGKRKRIEARSRHSLLQNEVPFTDDDDLNDQSGLYAVSNATPMRSARARQSDTLSTPLLSSARVSHEHMQTPATTTTSTPKPIAAPVGGGPKLVKKTSQTLTPPNSSLSEHHGRESRSTEPDHSLNTEPEYYGDIAPEVDGDMHEGNAGIGLGHDTGGIEVVVGQVAGTMTVEDASEDRQEISAPISRSQRARKPTPKVAAANDVHDSECLAVITERQQKSRAPSTEGEVADLCSRKTTAIAASPPRRVTTSVLPEEAHSRHEVNAEKEQRRKTTNALPEIVDMTPRDLGESSRLTRLQRVTRAGAVRADYIEDTSHNDGNVEFYGQTPEEIVHADLWQDQSLMRLANDEEREELFEQHHDDQHETQTNGNNKENEQPFYAHSEDGTQSKQSSRRNRDPNRPKRARRKPDEIERRYKCLFPECTKAYGELPHLNTHITDSSHGERWIKADYLEASKKQGNSFDDGMDQDDSLDFYTLVEERNAAGVVAALERDQEERNAAEAVTPLKRNQERVNRLEKLKQRDRMAKEAMEREEMMHMANGGV